MNHFLGRRRAFCWIRFCFHLSSTHGARVIFQFPSQNAIFVICMITRTKIYFRHVPCFQVSMFSLATNSRMSYLSVRLVTSSENVSQQITQRSSKCSNSTTRLYVGESDIGSGIVCDASWDSESLKYRNKS